jgi:hypothetical protein
MTDSYQLLQQTLHCCLQMTCIGHEGCLRDMQPLEEVIAAGTDDLQRPVGSTCMPLLYCDCSLLSDDIIALWPSYAAAHTAQGEV